MDFHQPDAVKRGLGWVLLVASTGLLVSFGGAIIAAPVTIPLLLLTARSRSSLAYRTWAGILVVLTTAELVWALTYLVQGDAKPAIWLVPVGAGVASVFGYTRLSRPRTTILTVFPVCGSSAARLGEADCIGHTAIVSALASF